MGKRRKKERRKRRRTRRRKRRRKTRANFCRPRDSSTPTRYLYVGGIGDRLGTRWEDIERCFAAFGPLDIDYGRERGRRRDIRNRKEIDRSDKRDGIDEMDEEEEGE